MDFALDEHQGDVQRRVRAFAATEVAPVAAALDRTGRIPPAVIDGVAGVGLLGCEHDFVAYVAGLIEISKEWASLGTVVAVHNSLVCYPISRYGDAAQKEELPFTADGAETARMLRVCRAAGRLRRGRDSDDRRRRRRLLRPERPERFVTSGRQARIAIVYALTDPSKGRDGLSAFIVETDTPGFAVGETNDMLGLRASEAVDVLLRDCRVPKRNMLGELNQGFAIAREIVEGGRIDIAAQAVGIGEACLEQSIAKAKDRKQFGRPIADFEAIQWMVADMSTEIDAARLLAFRAAAMRAKNPDDAGLTKAAAMAKLFASEQPTARRTRAADLWRSRLSHGIPVERYFRDARAMTLSRRDVGDRALGDRTGVSEMMTKQVVDRTRSGV